MKKINFTAYKVLNSRPVCDDEKTQESEQTKKMKEENVVFHDEPTIDIEAMALFAPKVYKDIFEETRGTAKQSRQRLSVVKITKGDRCIYRQYVGRSYMQKENDNNRVGLSTNSWQQLCLEDQDNKVVTVSKGCLFPFYWYHPHSATRISFKLGLYSVGLAVIGIIVSIIGWFMCC